MVKKLADITKKKGEIIFSTWGEIKELKINESLNLYLRHETFREMDLTKQDKGVLVYMSKKEFEYYIDLMNSVDDGR